MKKTNSPSNSLRPAESASFRSENIELCAFLLTRGHRLLGTIPSERLIVFEFEPSAAEDVPAFFSGSISLPPIKVFEAHRSLRALIATVRNGGGVA